MGDPYRDSPLLDLESVDPKDPNDWPQIRDRISFTALGVALGAIVMFFSMLLGAHC